MILIARLPSPVINIFLREVPWLDEHPGGVEWIFERQKPELASRMVHKMDQSQVVVQSNQKPTAPKAKAAAKPKAKARAGLQCGVDTFKICSEEVIPPCVGGSSGRVQTFVDVIIGSAAYVLKSIDRDFAQAASKNLPLSIIDRLT